MNKKFLKLFFAAALLGGLAGMAVSCKDYEEEITALSNKVSQLESTVGTLQSTVSNGFVITNVASTDYGYDVTVSNGTVYKIYNGNNGTNGTNGQDGKTPTLKLENGVLSYSYDGTTWTELGNVKGEDGASVVPQFKLEDGILYYSVDEGKTWVELGKVKGEDGESASSDAYAIWDKDNGTLTFHGLKDEDGNPIEDVTVYTNLELTSLVFVPEAYVDGVEAIVQRTFSYAPYDSTNADTKSETWAPAAAADGAAAEADVVTLKTVPVAKYHVNPAHAVINPDEFVFDFFVKANDEFISTRAMASDDFDVDYTEYEYDGDSILAFTLKITGEAATAEHISVVALNAKKGEDIDVTSDYATVYQGTIADPWIAEPWASAKQYKHEAKVVNGKTENHYRVVMDGTAPELAYRNGKEVWDDGTADYETLKATCDTSVAFNNKLDVAAITALHYKLTGNKLIDEKELVENEATPELLEQLGLSFEYQIVKNYGAYEAVTIDEKGVLSASAAASGQAVIVRVLLKDADDNVAKVAYIKVLITPDLSTIVLPLDPIEFTCDSASINVVCDSTDLQAVYDKFGLTKAEFEAKYPKFNDIIDFPNNEETGDKDDLKIGTVDGTVIDSLVWTIPMDSVYKYAGKTITHDVQFLTENGVPANVTLSVAIAAFDKVRRPTVYAEYWATWEGKYVTWFNVETPAVGETDSTKCQFENNPNAPFVQISRADQHLKFKDSKDNEIADTLDLQYYFCKTDNEKIVKIGDIPVTFSVLDDTVLLATVNGVKDTVAVISNVETDGRLNTVYFNKKSAIADTLLNTNALYVYIGAKAFECGDENKPLDVEFYNALENKYNECFIAKYVRPIDYSQKSPAYFVDAKDLGEPYTYLLLSDILDLVDWRYEDAGSDVRRSFSKYENYWDYYGPFEIVADTLAATCNLNHDDDFKTPLPNTAKFKQMTYDELLAVVPDLKTVEDGKYADPDNLHTDFLIYSNNQSSLKEDFAIKVPIKIKYGFGTVDAVVEIAVKKTAGHGAPRK